MYSENENYKNLFIALKNSKYNEAEDILSQGISINYKNSRGENLLWKAIDLNNLEIFEWLINKGCSIDNLNKFDESLLIHSINQNNNKFLSIILGKTKKNIDKVSSKGLSPLMLACSENKKEMIDTMISFGCDINVQNQYLNNALIIAIDKSDHDIVQLLIKNGADISLTNNDGDTALIISAKYRKLQNLVFLLESSSTDLINKKNKYGSTVASFIINSQFFEETPEVIINLLIEKKADFNVNIAAERTSSPLLESIKSGDIRTFLKLIDTNNINVNIIDSNGNDIMHYLCIYNYLTPKLLKRIIDCGYDTKNVKSKDGFTPYYALIDNKSSYQDIEEVIKILNEYDFKNPYKTLDNEVLLNICICNRKKELLNLFFNNNVLNINNIYKNGNKLIHKVTEIIRDSEEIGILYLEKELNSERERLIENDDIEYIESALEHIKEQENEVEEMKKDVEVFLSFIVKKCAENGISINDINDDGDTPLMLLISSGQSLMLQYFLNLNPNIHIENNYGENALCYAIKNGRVDVFKNLLILIDNNQKEISKLLLNIIYNLPEDEIRKQVALISIEQIIDIILPYINNRDEDNNTPLLVACALNEEKMVQILLKYGADPLLKNRGNETALMHACSNNNIEIVEMLIEKGSEIDVINNQNRIALDLTDNERIKKILKINN